MNFKPSRTCGEPSPFERVLWCYERRNDEIWSLAKLWVLEYNWSWGRQMARWWITFRKCVYMCSWWKTYQWVEQITIGFHVSLGVIREHIKGRCNSLRNSVIILLKLHKKMISVCITLHKTIHFTWPQAIWSPTPFIVNNNFCTYMTSSYWTFPH